MANVTVTAALLGELSWQWCGRDYRARITGDNATVFFIWCNGSLHGLSASYEDAMLMAEAVAARVGAQVKDFDLSHWQSTVSSPPPAGG